jgi:hypothetical protein
VYCSDVRSRTVVWERSASQQVLENDYVSENTKLIDPIRDCAAAYEHGERS